MTANGDRIDDPAVRSAMCTWGVDCEDCGASYSHKHRGEPDECLECGSENLDVRKMVPDGGEVQDDPDPILDECPECESEDLTTGDEINDSFWDDTDTACLSCTRVFDARGRFSGMFESDVARELHEVCTNALKRKLSGGSDA